MASVHATLLAARSKLASIDGNAPLLSSKLHLEAVLRPAAAVLSDARDVPRTASLDACRFAAFLLRPGGVLDSCLPLFGPDDRRCLVEPFFQQSWIRCEDILPVLAGALRDAASTPARTPLAFENTSFRRTARPRYTIEFSGPAEAARQIVRGVSMGWLRGAISRHAQPTGGKAGGQAWSGFVSLLCSVPSLATNVLHEHAPAALYPEAFFNSVLQALFDCLMGQGASVPAVPFDAHLQRICGILLAKLLVLGCTQRMINLWLERVVATHAGGDAHPELKGCAACSSAKLWLCVPRARLRSVVQGLAKSMCKVLRGHKDEHWTHCFMAVFLPRRSSCRCPPVSHTPLAHMPGSPCHTLWYLVVHRAAFSRHFLRAMVSCCTVAWEHGSFLAAVAAVVRGWASVHFASRANLPVQRSTTILIVESLRFISPQELDGGLAQPGLLTGILSGVQLRFSAPEPSYQRLGRLVASAFAQAASPGEAFDFGDVDDSDSSDWADAEFESRADAALQTQSAAAAVGSTPHTRRGPGASVDPAMPSGELISVEEVHPKGLDDVLLNDSGASSSGYEDSDDEDGSGRGSVSSDSSSDSDLVPYDMSEVGKPAAPSFVYLRELVSALREKEDYERAQAALLCVSDRVRTSLRSDTTRGQLFDVAVPLARTLLLLEDRFKTPGFSTWRRKALVSLCVCAPEHVVPYLTKQLYSSERSLSHRLDILDTLALAAQDLAGITRNRDNLAVGDCGGSPAGQSESKLDVGAGAGQPGPKVVGRVTRRWGKRTTPAPKASANEFSAVGSLFFFPLLRGVKRSVQGLDLLGKDSILLAQLIRVLAVVLECARRSLNVPDMVSALLELMWHLRYHDEPAVRQATLACVASILRACGRNPALLDAGRHRVVDALAELSQWVAATENRDPDPECRRIATALLKTGALQRASAVSSLGGGRAEDSTSLGSESLLNRLMNIAQHVTLHEL